jgi:hypothetical protein
MHSNLFSATQRDVGATRQAGGYGPGISIDSPVVTSTATQAADAH